MWWTGCSFFKLDGGRQSRLILIFYSFMVIDLPLNLELPRGFCSCLGFLILTPCFFGVFFL